MALKCSVFSCGNTSNQKGSDAVSFFEFPSTPTRKQNWLDSIGRPELRPIRSARVCSKHFDEKYFVQNGDRVTLKNDAVPFPLKRRQDTSEVKNPPIGIKRPRRNTVFIGSYNYDSKKRVPDSSSQNKPSIEQQSSNAVVLSAIATQRQRNTTIDANNLYSKSVAHGNTQTTHHSSNLPETTLPSIYSNSNQSSIAQHSSIGSNLPPQRPVISRNDVRPIVSNDNPRPPVSKVTNKAALLPITMNQRSIDTFFRKKTTSLNQLAAIEPRKSKREDCIFGWILLGSDPVPYIVQDSERFCSLRMLEKFSLAKFKKQTPKIGPCVANMQSFLVTPVQCDLLNEINSKHCDNLFGKVKFSMTEKLVRLRDAEKYHTFVHLCRKPAMKSGRIHSEGLDFGFTLVNKTSFIPYIILNERKFIPFKYLHCDEQIIYKLKGKTQILSDDDALYLKFCYKFDGIENIDDGFEVIELIEIQKLAPPNITFKNCWPMGDVINEDLRLILTSKGISFKSMKRNAIKWRSSQPA